MKSNYSAVLFAPDGENVRDFRGHNDIDEVWELISDMGSRWIFYPIPFVATAYQAFSEVQSLSQTSSTSASTSTLALRLQIPEADIDVEMFSVDRMTALMSDSTKATFRIIVQISMWLGALAMVIRSIQRSMSVTYQV